jgi:hypothetical protein
MNTFLVDSIVIQVVDVDNEKQKEGEVRKKSGRAIFSLVVASWSKYWEDYTCLREDIGGRESTMPPIFHRA